MEIKNSRYVFNKRQAKKRSSRVAAVFLVLVLLVSSGGYTLAALSKPIPELQVSIITLPNRVASQVKLPWPEIGQAAIGSLKDGVLETSSKNETRRPVASITKIVTALVLLEKSPYQLGTEGASYTVTSDDVEILNTYIAKNGTVIPVRAGQVITQQQAMQAILISSANNIADSLVINSFGSIDAYVTYANNYVNSKGLKNTTIADASGFSPLTTSTPSDLIKLGQFSLQQPVISSIVSTKQANLGVFGVVENTNRLLIDNFVIGIKTGNTDEAGNCLLFAVNHVVNASYTVTIIGVIVGSSSKEAINTESRNLINAAKAQFSSVTVASSGDVVGEAKSIWGQTTQFKLKNDLIINAWNGQELSPEVKINDINTPVLYEQVVGSVSMNLPSLVKSPVISSEYITQPTAMWRILNLF